MNIKKSYFKYVYQNILGTIGVSAYILADTYFIAKSVGAGGITALNLVLPVYGLIYAISAMIAVGSATRFSIEKNTDKKNVDRYFGNALFFTTVILLMFTFVGIVNPQGVVRLMGGDREIVKFGTTYTRIFMSCAPFFGWNFVCNTFVRNDNNPAVAMIATFSSSIFNIIFDYIFMFPCKMGMAGAALATSISPLVGVAICFIHFRSKTNTVKLIIKPEIKRLFKSVKLGVSAFVAEISQAVVTCVFNFLILKLIGNVGVAAYGIVANTSLVGVAVFNGIAQGTQPLFSECYGRRDKEGIKTIEKMSVINAFVFAVAIIGLVWIFTKEITNVFNSEGDVRMAKYAYTALRLYFLGYFFSSINIVGTGILSAVNQPVYAFFASVMRGFVAIIISAVIMSALFGVNGVWLAYPVAEAFTLIITVTGLKKIKIDS